MESLEHLLARTAAWATAATLELDEAALEVRHRAEYVLQEAEATVDPAIRCSRQSEGTRAVELAREIERLVAIQRRLGILATDVLTRARDWKLS